MRLAAQMRGGFYPAAPQAVAHAAQFLRPPKRGSFAIADPCAGQGDAIRQLGALLGCPQSAIHAIELDDSRAETLRAALPEARLLAPASFFGCRATPSSFSFMWLNPPFDHGYGGSRVEDQFLRIATDWLMPCGVMALVCPEDVADEYSDVRRHFTTYYGNCAIVPFPARHRPFNEVVVFGHKCVRPRVDRFSSVSWESVQAPQGFVYDIPAGAGPKVFQKVEPTETELQRMLANSPLRAHLTAPAAVSVARPPLALGTGHVALLLASGHLDGVVHAEGKPPHVVRGTSRKREYVADVTDTVNDDGSTTTRTTVAEKIELMVRTVDVSGTIQTFLDTDVNEE
jgi:predicted RNA methylase